MQIHILKFNNFMQLLSFIISVVSVTFEPPKWCYKYIFFKTLKDNQNYDKKKC